jgi:hypothetical protein
MSTKNDIRTVLANLCKRLALFVHSWPACFQRIINLMWARIANQVLHADLSITPRSARLVYTVTLDPLPRVAFGMCGGQHIKNTAGLPKPATIRRIGNACACWQGKQVGS